MKKKTKWKRKCPKCKEEIYYSTKYVKIRAEKRNTNCLSCVMEGKKRKPHSEETRKRMSESHKGIPRSEEIREKMSESRKGKNNPMYGKSVYDVWFEKYGKKDADRREVERCKKIRVTTLKNIENRCGQVSPNYNSVGCKLIDEYNKKHGYNFQHAENGGEVNVGGYFPDGLDEKRKTIIEIDEKRHFNSDGKLKLKDIQRQKYLESLGYSVIRIKI